MLQNVFGATLLHNRPVTPSMYSLLTSITTNKETKSQSSLTNLKHANVSYLHTYPPLQKDAPKEGKDKQSQKKSDAAQVKSQKPPWPPYGPSPCCCQPTRNQTCTPPPPRNPNPFYNYPQPYIKEQPPPPWRSPTKEPYCHVPHMPPLPPISGMRETDVSSLIPVSDKEVAKMIKEKSKDILQRFDDVMYKEEDDGEYYKELKAYFEPGYKNLEYFSFTKDSFSNMGVHLMPFYKFK